MQQEKKLQESTLFVAAVTAFMAPFMLSSINVALPAIQHDFAVHAVLLGWIATSYLLATAVFLVPVGKFADIYGRRKIFVAGIIVFTIGSFLSIFVWNIEWFLGMRVLQGLGAAMFLTTGMAILTSVFPPQKRGGAIGILVTAVYVGLATGPFAGGLLTQYLGWRSIFGVIFLMGAVSLYVALRYLKGEWAEAREESFDTIGSIVYALSISCLVYGGTRIPAMIGLILFLVGCLGLIIFFRLQKNTRHPIFEVSLFQQNRTFLFSSLAALIHYAATFAITFQISLYLQYIKGMTPQAAGTVLVTQPLMMAIFSAQAGKLSDRIEPRIIASTGMGLTVLGLAIFVFLSHSTPLWLVVLNLAILGFGFALFSSPNMSAIMGAVEPRQYGLASGAVATMRILGQMGSMTIATVFLALFIGREEIRESTYPLFLQSMHTCFAFFVIICLIGIVFSLLRGDVRR
ncbi:MAG: MFS transporter [Desulfobulbaceae bacterium]|nr:MFS transporter [Desulfobulbaceae bacterium]